VLGMSLFTDYPGAERKISFRTHGALAHLLRSGRQRSRRRGGYGLA
jgi:hypothetical protein